MDAGARGGNGECSVREMSPANPDGNRRSEASAKVRILDRWTWGQLNRTVLNYEQLNRFKS
jgi:hypothetical protein